MRSSCAILGLIVLLGCDAKPSGQSDPTGATSTTARSTATASAGPSASVAASASGSERPFPAWPKTSKALAAADVDAFVRAGEEQRTELTSIGAAPRTRILYAPRQAVTTLVLTVDANVSLSFKAKGTTPSVVPSPLLDVTVECSGPRRTSGDERIAVPFKIKKVVLHPRRLPSKDGPEGREPTQKEAAELAQQMKPILDQLVGIESELTVNGRGIIMASPGVDEKTPVEVLQLYSSIVEALQEMVVPLPEAEVGTGARWRVLKRLRRGGIVMVRFAEYELVELTETEVKLRATVRELPVNSQEKDPALGEQIIVRVIAGAAGGTHELVRPRGEVFPKSSKSTIVSRVTMMMKPPDGIAGKAVQATVRTQQDLTIKSDAAIDDSSDKKPVVGAAGETHDGG